MKLPGANDPSVGRFLSVPICELPLLLSGVAPGDPPVDERAHIRMQADIELRPGLSDGHGRLDTGAAIAILDNAGGFTAGLASLPDGWVVTTNLRYRRIAAIPTSTSVATASILRRGSRAVVTEIEFVTEGARWAEGILTSAVLPPEGGVPEWERPVRMNRAALTVEESTEPFWDWIGVVVEDDAPLEGRIEVAAKHRNPWGIVHGGVGPAALAGLIERAHPGHLVVDASLHYLAPVRVGPLRVTAHALSQHADGYLYEVNVFDEGADARCCVTGTMLAREVPAGLPK